MKVADDGGTTTATAANDQQQQQQQQQPDPSGKLVIKAQLGDDIRRLSIHNEAITYDELVIMMQRIFHSKLHSSDEVTIKYRDEDDDLVTIFDSHDLSFATQCGRVLKLTLFVNGQPPPRPTESGGQGQVRDLRVELIQLIGELFQLRNKVIGLLDGLEPLPGVGVAAADCGEPSVEEAEGKMAAAAEAQLAQLSFDPLNKRFDPMNKQGGEIINVDVMSAFGLSEQHQASAPGGGGGAVEEQHNAGGTPDGKASCSTASGGAPPAQTQAAASYAGVQQQGQEGQVYQQQQFQVPGTQQMLHAQHYPQYKPMPAINPIPVQTMQQQHPQQPQQQHLQQQQQQHHMQYMYLPTSQVPTLQAPPPPPQPPPPAPAQAPAPGYQGGQQQQQQPPPPPPQGAQQQQYQNYTHAASFSVPPNATNSTQTHPGYNTQPPPGGNANPPSPGATNPYALNSRRSYGQGYTQPGPGYR